jgi:hypothetical protein
MAVSPNSAPDSFTPKYLNLVRFEQVPLLPPDAVVVVFVTVVVVFVPEVVVGAVVVPGRH